MNASEEKAPRDLRAMIAVDLGAESCRVSLLQWAAGQPRVTLVRRFQNAPRLVNGRLLWNLGRIEDELDAGLRECAQLAPEGVRSVAVDGWAVDYVRLDAGGVPLGDPFCYRDERTFTAQSHLHETISPDRLRALTGVETSRINTLYQQHADRLMDLPQGERWLNLPEYCLSRWGARPVAEFTNATHTQLVETGTMTWSTEIFDAARLEVWRAPDLVLPGTILGRMRGELAHAEAFGDTVLIAPACHDTASAVAGIPAVDDDWAYLSSGTWSLVGTLLDKPDLSAEAAADHFTNLGAVGGKTCFHAAVNGMWLLRQCLDAWAEEGTLWDVPRLVGLAEEAACPTGLLDVNAPDLLLAASMPARINAQRLERGLPPIPEGTDGAPAMASLIFHSLAVRYADVLRRLERHTGKAFKRLFVVGGGSQNDFLNRLTAEATGLQVLRGSPESSTVGNFAVQLAALERGDQGTSVSASEVAAWAIRLQ